MQRLLAVIMPAMMAGLSLLTAQGTAIAQKTSPRVAVFSQTGFPYYGFSVQITPEVIAGDLRAAGLTVDLLDVDTLADFHRMNAKRYAAVILPYGNTYPQVAFANLKRFHQGGGSLVTTGIPFTHPAARTSAKGWEATPNWSQNVRLMPGQGKRPGTGAFSIQGSADHWGGVASSRFPVKPGQVVSVSALIKDATTRPLQKSPSGGTDELFIRFYDRDGKYLQQKGVPLNVATPTWKPFVARGIAPIGAAVADLSVQLRRNKHPLLATDFSATIDGKSVPIVNANLKLPGSELSDMGHQDMPARFGSEGIGIGSFIGAVDKGPAKIASDDPLHLAKVLPTDLHWVGAQTIDVKNMPAGVQVVPAVNGGTGPLVGLIVHKSGPFKGAVDAWAYRGPQGELEDFQTRQIIARGTVAALARRNVLSPAKQVAAFRGLDNRPRPTVYTNLILPTIPRKYNTFQPKMPPPARHLFVADVRKRTAAEKLMLVSLQGIVNRKQPRIYFLFDNDDKLWLDEMQKQKATDDPITVADPWSLLTKFRSEYKGIVLTDPKIYASPCIAVALSGADDLLIAQNPQIAARVKAPIKTDLRGKFKNNAEAYRYLRTKIFPRLDPYLTISLDPVLYDKGSLDQIIAAKGSAFWITGPKTQNLPGANQNDEMEEIKKLFAQMPLGAVVRGFWWHGDGVGLQEDAGVALGSRFGKVTLVSDYITNLSVHSGVPVTKLIQKPRPPAPKLDPTKVYLAFTMSDGDNLCTWRGYFRRYFDDPVRGSFPVGWGMGPALIDLAPVWARWYYENATPNDEFFCDVSGVAYMYPSSWGAALKDQEGAFKFFYHATEDYMERMDMKTLRLMDVNKQDIAHVGPLLPRTDFLLPDYGIQTGPSYSDFTYTLATGQPAFRAITNGQGPQNLAKQIQERSGKGRPAFVNAFIWNWGSSLSDLKKVLEILGPDYVAVTPSQLNELYKESKKQGIVMKGQTVSEKTNNLR